jgi:hypothetical protein
MSIIEALARNSRDKKLLPIERILAKKMAAMFRRQKRIFLRELQKIQSLFPSPMKESVTENEWGKAWDEAEEKTQSVMSELLQQAARASFAIGIDEALANIGLGISFSLRSPEAEQFLRDYGAQRVTMINETTREIIREIMLRGMEQGKAYSVLANEISERFSEFSAPRPQKHLRNRAELVAVTETANAYGEASRLTIKHMDASGIKMEKSWLTTGDARVSDGCRKNAAAGWLAIDNLFPSGHQREPRFPGCRCTVQYRRSRDE